MRMPFGKYIDHLTSELPGDYLLWLWENCDLHGQLADAVWEEIEGRGLESSDREDMPSPGFDADRWRRKMGAEFHPDRGGSKEAMQAINRGYELILEMQRGT